jgi:hypothetical protein
MTNFNDNWDKEGNCFRIPVTIQEKERFKIGVWILIAGLMGLLARIMHDGARSVDFVFVRQGLKG